MLLLTDCSRRANSWGGLRCPAVIVHQGWSGQTNAVGVAIRWTAVDVDGQMTFISAHLLTKERNRWILSRS